MRLKAFELNEPLPELKEPHVLAALKPWVDVGNAGTLALKWVEERLGASDLAMLARPGDFFDFTRHRPTSYISGGRRRMTIPNTFVTFSRQPSGQDFIFFHLLEPHTRGEEYVESVLELMQKFGVKRYTVIGSMHDYVPHTRPLTVTGEAVGEDARRDLAAYKVESIEYRGPTSICFLINQKAPEVGIDTLSLITHLPQYTQMEEDFMGASRLMNLLSSIYRIPLDDKIINRAAQQLEQINTALDSNPQLKTIIKQLENHYDARHEKPEEQETKKLSPEVEKFLAEMDKRFREE